jgi:hypothetical protein
MSKMPAQKDTVIPRASFFARGICCSWLIVPANKKADPPLRCSTFVWQSGIAAEREMTVSASKSVILSEAKDLRRYIGLSCGFMVLHESAC